MGKVFRKGFRILGLEKRKVLGGQYRNKIFMAIFRSTLHDFLPFSLLSLTELC